MPPKKDKKKGEGPALKEVDPTLYVRKATSLPEPDTEKQLPLPSTTGKIINVETIFPEWKDSDPPEVWSEPIPPEKVPQIKYPKWLSVEKTVNFTQFYELDVSDAPVDPKAKKKDPPKKPAGKGKGVEEPTEMVELAVNDLGKQLPVVYRDDGQEDFKTYPPMKSFSQKPIAQSNEADNAEVLDDVDPLVCDAFKIISTFVPLIITDSEHQHKLEHNSKLSSLDANYLWRSIYPKLPNGKPCYNPAGKYCVKIYFAGKWRKVYVDDTIPLTADGKPAVAFSSDRYELWPLLLSKAIYTVYSATGYTFADEFSEAMIANHPELSLPLLASQFVAFIVHIFTGWQNHQSVDAATIFQKEKSKSIHMLNYMVNNGIPLINYDDIVEEDPSFRFANEEPPPHLVKLNKRGSISQQPSGDYEDSGNGIEGEYDYENQSAPSSPSNRRTNNVVLKTKRKFKEEYTQRKQIRDDIVAAIEKREQKVNNISQTLLKGSLEVFFFVKFDIPVQRYRVYPLLGLAYDHNELPSHQNLLNIQFLLHWQRLPLEDTIPNVDDPIILGQGKIPVPEFLVPFPKASPIRYLWHSAEELMNENAFLTGLFTNIDTPYSVECSRHWISTTPAEPVNPDPKAKDKKAAKDPKGAPAPVIEEKLIDPGSLPITFLRVDTASICDAIEADFQSNDAEPITDDPTPRELDNELKEAIADQQNELEKVQSDQNSLKSENVSVKNSESKTDVKFHNYENNQSTIQKFSIKLVVTLMADITSEVVTTNPTRTSTMTNAATGAMMLNRQSSMHWDDTSGGQNRIHPSDTVVLLQEVRWEEDQDHHTAPLMFVVQMRDTAHLPMISKVFTIPFDRITSREPMLFWVRVFTRSSVYFNVAANVNVELNSAEKIWTESLGFSAIVKEGDSEVCVQDTEQLLFRCPVQVRKKTPALTEVPSTDVILNTTTSEASLHSPRMLIFLHVKDFPIEQLLQLLLVNINITTQDTEVVQISHPLGQILPINVQADFLPQLIAFITPQTLAAGGVQQQIPKFHWKLLVLSKDQLIEPENPIQESSLRHRFKGKYVANNKQCIFRDVYTIDKSSFPIALKLTVFPWEYDYPSVPAMEANNTLNDTEASTIIPGEAKENENSGGEVIHASRSGTLDEVDNYDVEYIFRIYRKSDLKLIGEYGTNNILHIYSIPLKPFLPEGEDENSKVNPVPDPKASKAAAAGKGAKGKGEVGINPNDVVDVIVECIIDNQRMVVPTSWTSTFPHVFDEFFPNQAGETSDAISFYQETLHFQKSYLKVKPPEKPLLSWKLDFLSGKVHGVSHDISNILKYYEVKKSWDQLDPPGNTLASNRLERAIAAANFIREREEWKRDPNSYDRPMTSASNKGGSGVASTAALSRPASKQEQRRPSSTASNRNAPATPSQDISTRASVQMSSAMVEALSQALGLENEEVKNRFNTLNQAKKIEEKVEVIPDINPESSLIYPHNPRTRLGSEMWHESVSSRRLEEKQKLEDYYQKLIDKSKELTSVYRNNCAERLSLLSQEYLSQRNDLLTIWKERESYRQEIETKNASLNYLLKRGKDARATTKQQEDAAEAERLKAEAKAAKSNKKK